MGLTSLHQRIARRRAKEAGLTLIELLVSLALLAVLTGFLVGGLTMGRRAFEADRTAGIVSETDAGIGVIFGLIGSALLVSAGEEGKATIIAFDGRRDIMTFVGLSEGHALPGGPTKFNLRRNGGDLVVNAASFRAGERELLPSVVVLTGVRTVRFGYFGKKTPTAEAAWLSDWFGSDHLPDLVSIEIDFEDERRNQPAVLVALRQG
jgi:general secretion pathway protein J